MRRVRRARLVAHEERKSRMHAFTPTASRVAVKGWCAQCGAIARWQRWEGGSVWGRVCTRKAAKPATSRKAQH